MTVKKNNPLLCDSKEGICEAPVSPNAQLSYTANVTKNPLRIIYFTDPICSSCWAIEPQLRKLKIEYGHLLKFEYHMGGLLPSWTNYNNGPISSPVDVAQHWDEMSDHYEMPLDGDIWLEDPLSSSYPPSIAFKAAELQHNDKALKFLRRIREMVFLEKKNITKWQYLQQAANETELDTTQLLIDYNGKAQELFQSDLILARQLGVKGFPSLFIITLEAQQTIYGYKSYEAFESIIKDLLPNHQKKTITSNDNLFTFYPTLTLKEFIVLGNYSKKEAIMRINESVKNNLVESFSTKNGSLWKKIT